MVEAGIVPVTSEEESPTKVFNISSVPDSREDSLPVSDVDTRRESRDPTAPLLTDGVRVSVSLQVSPLSVSDTWCVTPAPFRPSVSRT